jgi:hypothetical protein
MTVGFLNNEMTFGVSIFHFSIYSVAFSLGIQYLPTLSGNGHSILGTRSALHHISCNFVHSANASQPTADDG